MLRYLTAWLDEIKRIARLKLPPIADRRKYAKPRRRISKRRWSDVDTIVLHQTAVVLGERASRYDTLQAHHAVTRRGRRIHVYDLDVRVSHAQRFNARSVGIEVDGRYPGVEGKLSTLWDHPATPHREQPTELSEAAVEATKQDIRDICTEVEANGGKIRYLVTHRQASRSRRADPGGEIWRRIGLPMIAELGLSDGGPGFEVGGLPIPVEWDPSRAGFRY